MSDVSCWGVSWGVSWGDSWLYVEPSDFYPDAVIISGGIVRTAGVNGSILRTVAISGAIERSKSITGDLA